MKIGGFWQWLCVWCPTYWLILWLVPGSSVAQDWWVMLPAFPVALLLDAWVTSYRLAEKDSKQGENP